MESTAATIDENGLIVYLRKECPAVVVANRGEGDKAFLVLELKRSNSSSGDYLLPFVKVAMDSIDLTIDDAWLDPLQSWADQLRSGASLRRGFRFADISSIAGQSVLEGYEPPPLPAVIQVDNFFISKVDLTVWCALKLRTVRFLPQWIRTAIRMLSFSGQLTLDGERNIPPHRGSLHDFLRGLGAMYAMNLLSHMGELLGKSSVLNLPRVPLRILMTSGSYVTDSFSQMTGEAASLLSTLTLDEEYIARQRQIRNAKQIEQLVSS
eukprot:s6664_g1.t3